MSLVNRHWNRYSGWTSFQVDTSDFPVSQSSMRRAHVSVRIRISYKPAQCNWWDQSVMINLIDSRCSTHGLLLCFISLHISNGLVSTSLVGHVLYSADLMSAIYIPSCYLMVHRYIYSRYSSVFLTLYQLYHPLPSSTLISSSSLYLKLQPESLLKVVT